MFSSDEESSTYFEEHPEELRRRARDVFRRYIDYQLRMQAAGGTAWVECWQWPDAVGEVLGLPKVSTRVLAISARLKPMAQPWDPKRYNHPDDFERLLDQFERAIEQIGG